MTIRRILATAMTLVVLAACSSSRSDVVVELPAIEWRRCTLSDAECTEIQVPFDHDRPELGSFDLPIARHPARRPAERIGILLVNPGGPGGGGRWLAEDAPIYFSPVVLDRFDIIGWDPRGTAGARPELDCVDDMDPYFTLDPDANDDAARSRLVDAARRFVDGCVERSGSILPYVGTEATARDMDLIRRALGEDEASYFGFSYGSELGAAWITAFPDTVRAAVFDGAVDPTVDLIEWLTDQSAGFDRSLNAFLDRCDGSGCSLTRPLETARQTFDRIMASLAESPLEVSAIRPPIGRGTALIAVVSALYSESTWSLLDRALADADAGLGDRLLTLYDEYFGGYRDGHPDDVMDSYVAITCLDRRRAFDVDEVLAAMTEVRRVSPRLGGTVLQELLLCAQWPVEPTARPRVSWRGNVPILVMGSTGDPATPLDGTRQMYETLGNAHLVVVDSFDHTSYGSDPCATRAVDDYLVDPMIGPGETIC